jgi:hypothetical protein
MRTLEKQIDVAWQDYTKLEILSMLPEFTMTNLPYCYHRVLLRSSDLEKMAYKNKQTLSDSVIKYITLFILSIPLKQNPYKIAYHLNSNDIHVWENSFYEQWSQWTISLRVTERLKIKPSFSDFLFKRKGYYYQVDLAQNDITCIRIQLCCQIGKMTFTNL